MFHEDVADLEDWMAKNEKMELELHYLLSKFLHFRGERSMCSLGQMSLAVRKIAEDIDATGWVDFLHGQIPCSL